MAVSVDDILTPLAADGSEVREDLFTIAGYLRLYVPQSPSEPLYQAVDMFARWFTRQWNGRAVPALRAQFGRYASGDWATLHWRAKGVDRNLPTFASVAVPFENRSGIFHDLSAPGAVQITNPNGKTFTSQGPAPGSNGTLGIWPGGSSNYPTTKLIMQADEVGSGSNTQANSFAGYPAALASGPPGVYVGDGVFGAPSVTHGAALGSNGEGDTALLERGRASQALGAPMPVLLKFYAIALSTKLPSGVPVSTTRIRVISLAAVAFVFLATPSGPAPGDTSTAGTDVYEIDARLQRYCGAPGLTILTAPAALLTVAVGIITIYVDAASGVTIPTATATAQAAINEWQSKVPIGGVRKVANGQGYIFREELAAIAGSQVQTTQTWQRGATVLPGATVSANGGAYYTPTGGTTSSTGAGPVGTNPPVDGTVVWVYQGPASAGFIKAPGVFNVDLGAFADAPVGASQVAALTYSIVIVIVNQGL